MKRLFDKTALVTGAGRGLGGAISRRFAEEGAKVVVTDLDSESASRVAREIDGLAMTCDVTDSLGVDEVFRKVDETFGGLDILVNNAGISGAEARTDDDMAERRGRMLEQAEEIASGGPITVHSDATLKTTDEEWQRMLDVHLNGTFYCSRAALRIMSREGGGSIINMGSIMGTAGGGMAPDYCAAKAGILGFSRALARDVVTQNIRVNAIAPGWINTEMTAPLGEVRQLIAAQTPMRRFGEPDDIAWAAVYLASDESKFVTGQVLSPNGGWYMSQ